METEKSNQGVQKEKETLNHSVMETEWTEENKQIANMNIEGMPWYTEQPDEEEIRRRLEQPELTRRETRKLITSALFASLLIAGVFIGGLFLFLLFCQYVWLR